MCLAVPLKIVCIKDLTATVEIDGARQDVSLLILPEEANIGDYVLVHAGFAIGRLDEGAALETLELLKRISFPPEEPSF